MTLKLFGTEPLTSLTWDSSKIWLFSTTEVSPSGSFSLARICLSLLSSIFSTICRNKSTSHPRVCSALNWPLRWLATCCSTLLWETRSPPSHQQSCSASATWLPPLAHLPPLCLRSVQTPLRRCPPLPPPLRQWCTSLAGSASGRRAARRSCIGGEWLSGLLGRQTAASAETEEDAALCIEGAVVYFWAQWQT